MDEFTLNGRRVWIRAEQIPRGKRWDWFYVIDGSESVRNSGELAPSREVALSEAREHAERRIRSEEGP